MGQTRSGHPVSMPCPSEAIELQLGWQRTRVCDVEQVLVRHLVFPGYTEDGSEIPCMEGTESVFLTAICRPMMAIHIGVH